MTREEDYQYSNKTLFGIKSDAERYAGAGYGLFVIISSLVGDTIILIASLKYRAINLHKVIVVTIRHIALCDLMVTLVSVFPAFVSVVSDEWVLGSFLCYLTYYLGRYIYGVNMLLICTMTTSKLLLLKYPLRLGTVSVKTAHMICGACWLAAVIVPVTILLVNVLEGENVYFSYLTYTCEYGLTSNMWVWLLPLIAVVFVFIPNCVVVATTVYLLIIAKQVARRGRESLKWQGIMTTVLTASVYCISVLPYVVCSVVYFALGGVLTVDSSLNTSFVRIVWSFLCLNTISNFYIYSLSVQSFRHFIFSRIQLLYQTLTSIATRIATSTRQGM